MRKIVSTVIALAGSWFVVAADAAPTPSPSPSPSARPSPAPVAKSLRLGKVTLHVGDAVWSRSP